jgi:ABC-2 type transport system permease protein
MLAKLVLGTVLAFLMAIVTLVINRAVGSNPVDLVVVLFLAALYCGMWGLVFGAVSKDSTVLYSLIKGLGLFLFAPVIFYLFPNWPQWIAKLFPTYWIIEPIFQVSIMGARLGDVWLEIVVSIAIIIALIPLIMLLSRRMVDKIIVQ